MADGPGGAVGVESFSVDFAGSFLAGSFAASPGEGLAVGSGVGLTWGEEDGDGVGEGEASFPAIPTGLLPAGSTVAAAPTKLTPV